MQKQDASNGRFYPRIKNNENLFYPSSTTVLSAMPMESHMKLWFMNNTKEECESILNRACLKGSKVHHLIELLFKGVVVSSSGFTEEQVEQTSLVIDPEHRDFQLINYLKKPFTIEEDKMVRGFLNWVEQYKPEPIALEQVIYNDKYGYAGTVDFVGYVTIEEKVRVSKKNPRGGLRRVRVPCVIDWKTGKGLYESNNLQVASYLKGFNFMYKKRMKRAFLLHLKTTKIGYQFKEIRDVESKFKNFLHYLETWKIQHPHAKPRADYVPLEEYRLELNKVKVEKKPTSKKSLPVEKEIF